MASPVRNTCSIIFTIFTVYWTSHTFNVLNEFESSIAATVMIPKTEYQYCKLTLKSVTLNTSPGESIENYKVVYKVWRTGANTTTDYSTICTTFECIGEKLNKLVKCPYETLVSVQTRDLQKIEEIFYKIYPSLFFCILLYFLFAIGPFGEVYNLVTINLAYARVGYQILSNVVQSTTIYIAAHRGQQTGA